MSVDTGNSSDWTGFHDDLHDQFTSTNVKCVIVQKRTYSRAHPNGKALVILSSTCTFILCHEQKII